MQQINLNKNWEFRREAQSPWEAVSLPHTPRLEALEVSRPFQGVVSYRKRFQARQAWANCRVALRFEGAMQSARVLINGRQAAEHAGGYLPFVVEIDPFLSFGAENLIEVTLDNRDDKTIPPGKPTDGLDFLYYGGLYRDVALIITPKVYLTDAVQADLPHAGGLLAETRCADERVAAVFVQATVGNRTAQARSVPVALMLLDEKGATVGMERGEARVPAGGSASFSSVFHIENPRLWSPDHPALYTLACRITNENGEEDTYEETTGIRFAQITEQGFSLNGKPLKLWGRQPPPAISIYRAGRLQ